LRVVVSDALLPASEAPRRIENAGITSTSMTTLAMIVSGIGRLCTNAAQRAHPWETWTSIFPSAASFARCLRPSTRFPNSENRAGSSVTATATANTTMIAADSPIPDRMLNPSMSSPSIATVTVPPAKMTARPEVSMARTVASSGVIPAWRPLR